MKNGNVTKLIAVVGVSADPEKYGHKIFRDLLKTEHTVYGVNPKESVILNQQMYQSLAELPDVPDLVMTVVPPAVTEAIVDMCHQLGIKRIWMQPGSESEKAIQKAEEYGMQVTAHQCFMRVEGLW
jgi:hypothetical protein